ncbi:putative metal-dependent phosphoesterase TrpH [Neobacillus niacini]|uniref:PHP domain-containing protein n=1 Tax=Neobacillus niacini TaxID=86668 RepID=UPI002780133E|nr:PHP domain-containing protein [Neobacillus niacini]MDQ1000546.1 putative metal-dependent phosphoesterase TrpH [Neobacillus niacini]
MKIELHCHTNISDCPLSIDEVLELALAQGVTHLAVTNHDTTRGLEEAVETGKRYGIEVIPGIEMSGFDFKRGRRAHILGYFIEPGSHEGIETICQPLVNQRHKASEEMVERLIAAGYQISWERCKEIAHGGTGVYKQHIMHALIEAGYTTSIYGLLYKKLFNRGQNGEEEGIAFIPMKYMEAKIAVQVILLAGGVPVLAHPGQYGNFELVPELVEAGLQGIEVWHPLHDEKHEEQARQLARKYDLIMTGGSDFHGEYGEQPVLLGSKSPGMETLEALLARRGRTAKTNSFQ